MTPRHQWTHDGTEVLILRFCAKDGASSHGFVYPLTVGSRVEAPDWTETPSCGGGLHGWPWGFSMGDGMNPEWTATWLVLGALPADVIDLGGNVKVRQAIVRYVGDWQDATAFVLPGQMAWVHHAAEGAERSEAERGAASATGGSGAASATGERGAASATGWSGAASATGWSGAASATGERGAASATGERGAASATGERGAASVTGGSGAAVVTGLNGKAQAGEYGCLALAWWNARAGRVEMRCARTGGKDGLKPHTWYRMNGRGKFVEYEP